MAGQIIKQKRKDGSIIEDTWLVRIFLGRESDGKRKYFSKTIHGKKKDADKYLTAKLREKDLGTFVEPAAMPLKEYLASWLEEVAKPRLRENTYDGYKLIVETYIQPTLGLKRLSDLQSYQIQKFYIDLQKKGLSARTVRYVHSVLSSALKQAVKWRQIFQNPCDLCELPKQDKAEMRYFTSEEVKLFLETAKASKHYTLFLLTIETGLRPGEYLALQWKDIDLDQQTLSVRRSVKVRKGGGFYFTEPKTKKSRRSIPLSDTVINALRSHRRDQLEASFKLGSDYQKNDIVFANEIGAPILLGNLRRRHFEQLIKTANKLINEENENQKEKKAGLPMIRLYDLRHTTATLLLSAGLNPKVVSERLGHASIVLTLDTYSHVLPNMQQDATNKIEKLMFGT